MKKVLAFLLVVVLVASASVCVAFALSPEAQGVISGVVAVDKNEAPASLSFQKIDGNVNKYFYNAVKGLKDETSNKTLKVVGHYDVDVTGNPEYPLTITLDVLGVSNGSIVHVLLQKGKEVISVTPTVQDGKVTFVLDEPVDKVALVTDGKTAEKVEKENNVLSPQTADATPFVAALMAVMALAFVVVSKKVKA